MSDPYAQDDRTTAEWIHDLVVARQEAEAERDALAVTLAQVATLPDQWMTEADGPLRGMAAKVARDHRTDLLVALSLRSRA